MKMMYEQISDLLRENGVAAVVRTVSHELDKQANDQAIGWTSDRKLIRKLRNLIVYTIELIDENCDCGRCAPCRKSKSLSRWLKQVDALLKPKAASEKTGG